MALNLPPRECEYEKCKVIFKPKRRNQRFHDRKCRYLHYNSLKTKTTCPHCGKPLA